MARTPRTPAPMLDWEEAFLDATFITAKKGARQSAKHVAGKVHAHGRPRPSLRSFGSGKKGANTSHCASSNRTSRFLCLMAEDHKSEESRHGRSAAWANLFL